MLKVIILAFVALASFGQIVQLPDDVGNSRAVIDSNFSYLNSNKEAAIAAGTSGRFFGYDKTWRVVDWSELGNKPSTFTAAAHTASHKHGGADEVATATATVNAIPKADGTGKLDVGWIPTLSYAALSHVHIIGDITDLQTTLNNKASSNASITINSVLCTLSGTCTIPSGSPGDLAPTMTSGTAMAVAAGSWGVGSEPQAAHAGSTVTISSLSITGATNASPIVLTVASTALLRNGDTIMVSGVLGNTAANGTWSNIEIGATSITLTGSTGNGAYTSGGTVAGTGNGTVYVYGDTLGNVVVEHPASAGLVISCSGSCIVNQVVTPAYAADGMPIGTATIVGGAITAVADGRRFLTSQPVSAGQGISVTATGGVKTIAVDSTVARTSGNNTYTGSNDFGTATRTAPHRKGTGSPVGRDNCTTGDSYFQTDATAGNNTFGCTATNTWTLQGDGGAAGNGKRPCEVVFTGSGTNGVLQDTDDLLGKCKNLYGATLTIESVSCWADAGSPTVMVSAAGGSDILTGNITAGTFASPGTGTLSGTPTSAANAGLDFKIVSAGGTAKEVTCAVGRTL